MATWISSRWTTQWCPIRYPLSPVCYSQAKLVIQSSNSLLLSSRPGALPTKPGALSNPEWYLLSQACYLQTTSSHIKVSCHYPNNPGWLSNKSGVLPSLVVRVLRFGPGVPGSIPSPSKSFVPHTLSSVSDPDVKKRKPSHSISFSMGHAGASRKSPHDAPRETLSLRLNRSIFAPLLTVALSLGYGKEV